MDEEREEPFDVIKASLEMLAADTVFSAFCTTAQKFTVFTGAVKDQAAELIYYGKEHREYFRILTQSYEKLTQEDAEKADALPDDLRREIDGLTRSNG